MLDPWVRRRIDAPLNAIGRRLAARGVSADTLTWLGFACGLGAAAAVALEATLASVLLLLVNRVLDGLDGAVARVQGATDRGGFLDITLDFLVYAALPLGFAIADPERNALWATLLLFAFVGTSTSFLSFAVFAQKRGLQTSHRGHKSLYYLGGLAEGTETTLVFVLMCMVPAWFPWLAAFFALACMLTAGARIWQGTVTFADPGR